MILEHELNLAAALLEEVQRSLRTIYSGKRVGERLWPVHTYERGLLWSSTRVGVASAYQLLLAVLQLLRNDYDVFKRLLQPF